MKVKLILKEDVENLGITGDVVEVSAGYARNFLLPKDLARSINSSTVQEIERAKKRREIRESDRKSTCVDIAERMNGLELSIAGRVSEAGTLYGAVSKNEVADALAEKGFNVAPSMVAMPKIKELGDYQVTVLLHSEVTAECRLTVVADDSDEEVSDEIPDELSDMEMGDKKIEEAMDKENERGRGSRS